MLSINPKQDIVYHFSTYPLIHSYNTIFFVSKQGQ